MKKLVEAVLVLSALALMAYIFIQLRDRQQKKLGLESIKNSTLGIDPSTTNMHSVTSLPMIRLDGMPKSSSMHLAPPPSPDIKK